MVVERDGVGGDVLLHAVFPRLISVAPAASRVGERRVLPGGDRRGGFVRLSKEDRFVNGPTTRVASLSSRHFKPFSFTGFASA